MPEDQAGEPRRTEDRTALWLSHHPPEQHERCVRVGRRRVCRRCLVLWPLSFAVMVAVLVAGDGDAVPAWWVLVLPLPAVVEFCAEQARRVGYAPVRQVAVTVLLGLGLGGGFGRYLADPGDLVFWAAVVVYGGVCLAFVAWRLLDEHAP